MSREDVDDLLERYLESAMADPVTKTECREKHTQLDMDVEKSIKEAMAKTSTGLKLWAVGSVLAAIIAVLVGYSCGMAEVGAYKERIDNNTRQLDKLERGQDRLIQMHIQGGSTP